MREIRDRGNNKAGWKEYEREREREKREYTEEEGRKKERKRDANSRGDLEEGLRPLLLLR